MRTSDFDYELPEERIAQTPVSPRDSSRMLVYDRASRTTEHKHFYDLPDYLRAGDVLVVNNTRVLPARLYGTKDGGTARVEILLLKRIDLARWEVLIKPGKRFKAGARIIFNDELSATVEDVTDTGERIIAFSWEGVFEDVLTRVGTMPLPPYIHEKLTDPERYQTVYNKVDGSSAAPTAGLHFTPELMQRVRDMGVEFVEVTLNVGLGTFRPVQVDDVEHHVMHSEYFTIDEAAAQRINAAKREGRRVIAVGTTSVRVLESAAVGKGVVAPSARDTNIFIYPPYEFKIVDGLITNFHLPQSTLIMLVSAFCGKEQTLAFYREAVEKEYRFFSFGDATLLL